MGLYLLIIAGFVAGFLVAQSITYYLLKDMSREEILENKKIKVQYGLLNWAVAFIGAYVVYYFLGS